MAAIPDALIDTVSLCGPPDVVRERLAVYRDAGVGTLGVTPIAFTADRAPRAAAPASPSSPPDAARSSYRRATRASPSQRVLLGAFGDPGHAFPMIALGRALARARARRHAADLGALARARRGRGHDVRGRARVHASSPPAPSRWTSTRRSSTPRATRCRSCASCAPMSSSPTSSRSPPRSPPSSRACPARRSSPTSIPTPRPRLPDLLARRAPAAHRRRARALAPRAQRPVEHGLERGRVELNGTRAAARPAGRSTTSTAASAAELALVATFPQLEYPRTWPRARPRRRAADVGAAGATTSSCRPGDASPLVLVAPSTAQDPEHRLLRAALRGLADAPVRVLATWNRRLPSAPAARARQRARRRLGLLLAHDAPLRRRRLPRRPRHARARARLRLRRRRLPRRRRHERERRAPGLGGRRRARAAALHLAAPSAPGRRARRSASRRSAQRARELAAWAEPRRRTTAALLVEQAGASELRLLGVGLEPTTFG